MANQPRAATLERVTRAVELRSTGATWPQVAEDLGYKSPNAAEASVRQYLRRMQANTDLGQMLMQEELKLQQRERYIMAASSKVSADDVQGRDIIDKARDRIATSRAKLWGLYAPERHQVAVAVTAEDTRERLLAVASERDRALTHRAPLTIEGTPS